jgi:hypothetical protein
MSFGRGFAVDPIIPCSFQLLGLCQGYKDNATEMSLSIRFWIVDFFAATPPNMIFILQDRIQEQNFIFTMSRSAILLQLRG